MIPTEDGDPDLSKASIKPITLPRPRSAWSNHNARASSAVPGFPPNTNHTQVVMSNFVPPSAEILYPTDKTRPKLLHCALKYIRDELRLTGAESAPVGDPRRLQVFRTVFDMIIEEFKTYSPILSEVKQEYETLISSQQSEIVKLLPLDSKLCAQRAQSAREVQRLSDEAVAVAERLRNENRKLNAALFEERKKLEGAHTEISDLTKKIHGAMEATRNDEFNQARLKELYAELEASEKKNQDLIRQKEDEGIEFQRTLRRVHAERAEAVKELGELQLRFSLSVPKQLFEEASTKANRFQKDLEDANKALRMQREENEKLKQNVKALDSKLLSLQKSKDFPNWEYIEGLCKTDIYEWAHMCKDFDSNDSIVVLLRELIKLKSTRPIQRKQAESESQSAGEPRFFIGLGLSSEVPKYLRFKGKIPNHRLSKKDCTLLFRDIWSSKILHDASTKAKNRLPLADFLFMYLKKKFGSQDVVAEWGYNLLEAAKKYRLQSIDCMLFHDILTDVKDESLYHHLQAVLGPLKHAFHRADLDLHEDQSKGFITKSSVPPLLRSMWPEKNDADVQSLLTALDSDQPGEYVTYKWLFQNAEDCTFLDVFREQHLSAMIAYISGLRKAIQSMYTKDARLSATEFSNALTRYDADKSRRRVDEYVARGFGVLVAEVRPRMTLDKEKFLENLGKGIVGYGNEF
ncbi:hypothetical protein BJ742DRAFT_868739 [Cladochytrium replicatum]|nr:hypothetical protein BJ742DRAFT_868739 [Cladochytrium replicatum]